MNPFCLLNAEMFVEVVRQRAGSSLLLDLKKCIDPSVVTNRCLKCWPGSLQDTGEIFQH